MVARAPAVATSLYEARFSYTDVSGGFHSLEEEFVCKGFVALAPEALGVDDSLHDSINRRQVEFLRKHPKAKADTLLAAHVPEILDLLGAPCLVAACEALLGTRYGIAPFTHNGLFPSKGTDQHWHKDDCAPLNARKQRHHQAIQAILMYYPQEVRSDMGPTVLAPFSQYWTVDHETNFENFAGPDHVDFDYMVPVRAKEGGHAGLKEQDVVTGPTSRYSEEEIQQRRTRHDLHMKQVLRDLEWPLIQPFDAAPLRAGSVVICSHNLFHRGCHRCDDWSTWAKHPRYMWRFNLYRTMDPVGPQISGQHVDHHLFSAAECDGISDVWCHQLAWLRFGSSAWLRPPVPLQPEDWRRLGADLLAQGVAAEPRRICAAYRLAASGDVARAVPLLEQALVCGKEDVRRAATYGLVALGPAAEGVLLRACLSQDKWVRRAGVYGLGDAVHLRDEVLGAVEERLFLDDSAYVRAVAAYSIGCLGRRAAATGSGRDLLTRCMQSLLHSLQNEQNRLAMDKAQNKMIKLVRPTPECDVCEGSAVTPPLGFEEHFQQRFDSVRSAVREAILWSMVILCSQGTWMGGETLDSVVPALTAVARADRNPVCSGFAVDALHRLATSPKIANEISGQCYRQLRFLCEELLAEEPVRSWEPLACCGLTSADLIRLSPLHAGAP